MSPATTSSSRWCPTPEQLMILEEIYRNGLKTPNAAQIQQITSHLSLYGKIEGKNVFYWFQNHKARDRQKLRRKLYKQLQLQQQQQQLVFHYQYHPQAEDQQLMRQRRFNEQQNFHHLQPQCSSFGLHQQQQQLLTGHFHEREVEEAPTMKATCRSGPLRTLELFPITATCVKEESASAKDGCCSSSNN